LKPLKPFSPLLRDASIDLLTAVAIAGEEIEDLMTPVAQSIENGSRDRLQSRLNNDPIAIPPNRGTDACQELE
jgi:hypothetical protein